MTETFGQNLAELLKQEQQIPIDQIISLLERIAVALAEFHEESGVHIALSPDTIVLCDENVVHIFKREENSKTEQQLMGADAGSIDYVPPEYLERGQIDLRTDIYALGAIAYQLVVGELPFMGSSVVESMTLRLRADPDTPSQRRSDCPSELSDLILRAMSRDPDERQQTVQEFLQDLKEVRIAMTVQ